MLLIDVVNLLPKEVNEITIKLKNIQPDNNIKRVILETYPEIAFCVPISSLTDEYLKHYVLEIIPNYGGDGACFVIGEW